jgi:uncharacterized membrane protein
MKRFLRWLRATFVSGVLAILPIGATVYILWVVYVALDSLLGRGRPIGDAIERTVGHRIPGLGIALLIALILLVGVITRNFIGRALQVYFERPFFAVPGVRRMFGTFEQFASALFGRNRRDAFKQVVLFEFPQPGTYAVGVVTNENTGTLEDAVGEECVSVYLPNAPNPLGGRMFVVPRRRVKPLDMSVEEAISMFVSSGAVLPGGIATGEAREQGGNGLRSGSRGWPKRRREGKPAERERHEGG